MEQIPPAGLIALLHNAAPQQGHQHPDLPNVQILNPAVGNRFDGREISTGRYVSISRLDLRDHIFRTEVAGRLLSEGHPANPEIAALIFPPGSCYHLTDQGTAAYWIQPYAYRNFREYIVENAPLPEDVAKNFFGQVCNIVGYLHDHGILIRDLSFQKFVFADEDHTLLKLAEPEITYLCPKIDRFDGTPMYDDSITDYRHLQSLLCYKCPEALTSTGPFQGKSANMYSLGIMLYAMVTGRNPFQGHSIADIMTSIIQGDFHIPRQIPEDLRYLIRFLLNKNPPDRPTIAEVMAYPWLRPPPRLPDPFDWDECVWWKKRPKKEETDLGEGPSGAKRRRRYDEEDGPSGRP